MAKNWANGLPDEGRSPKSGRRMAAEGMLFSWRWNLLAVERWYDFHGFGCHLGNVDLDVIWGMSANTKER